MVAMEKIILAEFQETEKVGSICNPYLVKALERWLGLLNIGLWQSVLFVLG